jgi:hypothetical protein
VISCYEDFYIVQYFVPISQLEHLAVGSISPAYSSDVFSECFRTLSLVNERPHCDQQRTRRPAARQAYPW